MAYEITISAGNVSLAAELNNTQTARRIWNALPIEGAANTWGEEIYFEIPLKRDAEPNARADVEVGELAYWPAGRAFCIFFGPTPSSIDEKPRAYSPVTIIGRVLGDAKQFKSVEDGDSVKIERAHAV